MPEPSISGMATTGLSLTELGTLALFPLAGLVLGAFFFGGLWWTVRRAMTSPRPALLFFTSLLLRMVLTLLGFYLVAGGQWQRLLLCLFGFVLARPLVTRWTRPSPTEPAESAEPAGGPGERPAPPTREIHHAP